MGRKHAGVAVNRRQRRVLNLTVSALTAQLSHGLD